MHVISSHASVRHTQCDSSGKCCVLQALHWGCVVGGRRPPAYARNKQPCVSETHTHTV